MSDDPGTNTLALRSFLLGAVCGGRTLTGLAAVALSTDPDRVPRPLAGLAGAKGRRAVTVGALGEIVADKLPGIPSRLAPPSLLGRAAVGAVAASFLASRSGRRPAGFAVLGASGAVAGSVVGARWRAAGQQRGWSTLAAAVAEDLVVVGLAAVLSRSR
jgi:uncharacterized membrane protein